MCKIKYKTPKEISVVFHNGSYYDYHSIIKPLTEKFKGQFKRLDENTEKYIFTTIQKYNEYDVVITYKIKFIDVVRFMASSLSTAADNLTEELHKDKCKYFKSSTKKVYKKSTCTYKV